MIVDLIVFNMLDFDLILEMDFLKRYRAEINCQRKKVKFTLDNSEKLSFGEGHLKNMSKNCVKGRKMLSKGCSRYLAYVVTKDNGKGLSLKDVLVVQEFFEVFLEDLLGLASKRKVEFCIKFALSTIPISKAL